MTQPPQPRPSLSSTSLGRLYHGPNGSSHANMDDMNDPKMDFCNAFWGQGDKGYDVVMARLRGATRTIEELRVFWKERAAIEEDYAKRLTKLSKSVLGKDEIGDLASALQHVLNETAAQAGYHQALGTEMRQTVEQPTAEFGNRLSNLKKGLQASVEKAYKNKGLQEGHLARAKEKYESDCLKLNSYTANSSIVQGRELDKVHQKLDRVRQTIGVNEQEFRQLVKVLEGTQAQWESEWRGFCDHVQDVEEDRLALVKDIIWAYANAVSQVCVDDDSSCERIREKLEQFEPQNDMLAFVRGWSTGDTIPDPPKFINYGAGETFSSGPTFHHANFRRISSKPPMSSTSATNGFQPPPEPPAINGDVTNKALPNIGGMSLSDPPLKSPTIDKKPPFGGVALPGMSAPQPPTFGAPQPSSSRPDTSMPPPPVPATAESRPAARNQTPVIPDDDDPMAKALANLRREPPPPDSVRRNPSNRRADSVYSSAGSQRGSIMGQGMKSPASPGPGSGPPPIIPGRDFRSSSPLPGSPVQQRPYSGQPPRQPSPQPQAQSHRAPSPQPQRQPSPQPQRQPSPAPGRQPSPAPGRQPSPAPGRQFSHQTQGSFASHRSMESTSLLPPASGHTAAALAKSMDDFQRQASRDKSRSSVNYANMADDVVGAHPSSRPTTPSGQAPANRAPSPAMMQAPQQPATHIADEVLSQYHQAFPGERSRSRAGSRPGSIISSRSRANSFNSQAPPQQPQQSQGPPTSPSVARDGFAGIGARGRSPSPQPAHFRSPSPSPVAPQGSLGPQNIGISLDEKGGVAHDSMAEAYRRQYEQQQAQQKAGAQRQSQQSPSSPQQRQSGPSQYQSFGGPQQQQQQQQYGSQGFGGSPQPPAPGDNRPVSGYGAPQQQQQQGFGQQPQSQYGGHGQFAQHQQSPQPQQQPQQQQQQYYPTYTPVQQQPQQPPQQQYQPPQQQQPVSSPPMQQQQSYQQNSYQPQQPPQQQYGYQQQQPQQAQQQTYGRGPSPAPQQQPQQSYGFPTPQQPQQHGGRSPSPQPQSAPANPTPTGQWSTTGLPILFYVKALYDYAAQSGAEFDFQAGDVIAVTSTPDDGWWSGELLDEARRLPGRTDFPSNFVCLF